MMQRLMHPPNIVWCQARSHRLYTLALARQQQAGAVGLPRTDPVGMPCGLRQAIKEGRQALLLGAWRREARTHKTILLQNVPFRTQ